jgi:hypothetical protein
VLNVVAGVALTMLTAGSNSAGTITAAEWAVTLPPVASVPATSAMLATRPESRSSWVVACEPVQIVCSPAGSSVSAQATWSTIGSATAISLTVRLPRLVTVKV